MDIEINEGNCGLCQIDNASAERLVYHCSFVQFPASARSDLASVTKPTDIKARVPNPDDQHKDSAENVGTFHKLFTFGQQFGLLFLERMRLIPNGTAIGENIYTLSLAPQETVVMTQKSFSRLRESSEELLASEFEEVDEKSSVISSELTYGIELAVEKTSNFSLNTSISGSYGPTESTSINGTVSGGYNASDAERDTRTTSSKTSRSRTEKAASRSRSQHKTVFKLLKDEVTVSGSTRTIQNLNTCHSMMLNYFKVFQKIKIRDERYDARLCWSPNVEKPGKGVLIKAEKTADETQRALDVTSWFPEGFPPEPGELTLYSSDRNVQSDYNGVAGDFDCDVIVPDGHELLRLSAEKVSGDGVVGQPQDNPNPPPGSIGPLKTYWHVGLPCELPTENFSITFRAKAVCRPTTQTILDWHETLRVAREDERKRRLEAIDNSVPDNEVESIEHIERYDALTELMRRVISERVNPTTYDLDYEVIMWHDVFDWEGTSYQLFPSWWNRGADGTQSAKTDFLNASFARLFIPVKVGREYDAMRLILGNKLNPNHIDSITEEVKTIRAKINENKFIVLDEWEELVPTDGTYVEPVLGKCIACDDALLKDIKITQNRRTAGIEPVDTEEEFSSEPSESGDADNELKTDDSLGEPLE